MLMATKLGRMATDLEQVPPIKSDDHMWSCKTT